VYLYVYPYGYIVGPLMIVFLVISIALFQMFPSKRKYVLFFLFLGGLFEVFNRSFFGAGYPEGVIIGFLTSTCVGILAVLLFLKAFAFRVFASLPFFALGGFAMYEAVDFMSKAEVSFLYPTNLTPWVLMVSWAMTALGGGVLLLIAAFRNRFA
jgi:hypothetical protein